MLPERVRSTVEKNAAVPFRDELKERERQVLQGLCESLSNN